MSRRAGFTLIEVLIVMLLLTFIAIGIFQTVRSTVAAKEDFDERSETLQMGRAAYTLIDRDLQAAFLVLPEDFGWNPRPASMALNPQAPPPLRPSAVTIFQGKQNELFFSATTHQRLFADSPENEQHFVTYQLNGDELIRAESLRAVNTYDREDPSRFRQFKLLQGVKTFKLGYWNQKNERWEDSWDSENGETKDQIPPAVRVELEFTPELEGRRRRKGKEVQPIALDFTVRPLHSALKNPTGKANSMTITTGSAAGTPFTPPPSGQGGGGPR